MTGGDLITSEATEHDGVWLRLRFLGGCEVLLPDGPAHLETAKTRALLAYLALNPGPHSRQRLMGLLWGDLPEANARRNLRRALWNLRKRLSPPDGPPPFLADRETVRFNPVIAHRLDVAEFEAACAAPEGLRRAAELYRGELLAGFFLRDAPAFEEWLLVERERLRLLALQSLQRLVEKDAAQGEIETALDDARRLLALEPWREESHRWLMRLLVRAGRRSAALAQYETCRRTLAQELGVEPGAETTALYRRIRAGDLTASVSRLPAPTTPFVGRARELAALTDLLADDDCRLITITGLGGVGKSRLALEAAARYPHGAVYAGLNDLESADRLPTALAQALGVPLLGAADPPAALRAFLREKRLLLLLDGFEQLPDAGPLLAELLAAAPGLKLLVTSRRRLGLQGEWVYDLGGLEAADAARLFVQTARRLRLGFQVGAGEEEHLARICRLVDGLPLALEMAAAWVRILSLEQIAAEIAAHLDFLNASLGDRPARHRSIRAVLDHAWQRLSPKEQRVLAYLSVFRGDFRRREAEQAAGATPATLIALVDRSLLQRLPSGRYRLHELVRHYAAERLAETPDEEARARDRHCRAYAAPLARYEQALAEGNPAAILDWLTAEKENVRAAWHWAAARRDSETLAAMLPALTDAHHLTADFREGEALFAQALAALEGEAADLGLLPWRLRNRRAAFAVYLGRFDAAQAELERCLAVFARHGIRQETAHCRFFLGEIARFRGEHGQARAWYAQSLADYRAGEDAAAVGFCLNGLGLVAVALGDPEGGRAYLQQSLDTFGRIGHEMGQAIAGANLADLLIHLGEGEAAREVLAASAALFQKLDHRWGQAACLRHQGDLARQAGHLAEAKGYYREGLRLLREIGQRQAETTLLIRLGRLCAEGGEEAEARRYLEEAVALAAELGDAAQEAAARAEIQKRSFGGR